MAAIFADDVFRCIPLNENEWNTINISLRCFPIQASIGSDNGLELARWQAIIWTDDGSIADAYMRYSASIIKYFYDAMCY